jgi:hypothetical protein
MNKPQDLVNRGVSLVASEVLLRFHSPQQVTPSVDVVEVRAALRPQPGT